MPPRNHSSWIKEPNVEYINSLIYSDHALYEQEIDNIFSKVWVPMCHSSELPNLGDFRKTQIALQNVVAVRFSGGMVKTFLTNNVKAPSGNNLALTYHSGDWQELPCEVKHGGMVWTTLNTNPTQSVDEWTCGAFDCIADAIDTEEMEVLLSTMRNMMASRIEVSYLFPTYPQTNGTWLTCSPVTTSTCAVVLTVATA